MSGAHPNKTRAEVLYNQTEFTPLAHPRGRTAPVVGRCPSKCFLWFSQTPSLDGSGRWFIHLERTETCLSSMHSTSAAVRLEHITEPRQPSPKGPAY